METVFGGDAALRAVVVAQVKGMADEERFEQNVFQTCVGGDEVMGCLLGGMLAVVIPPPSVRAGFTRWREAKAQFGVPEQVAAIAEFVFDEMPADECAAFAVDFVESLPLGGSLDTLVARLMVVMLSPGGLPVTEGTTMEAAADLAAGWAELAAGRPFPERAARWRDWDMWECDGDLVNALRSAARPGDLLDSTQAAGRWLTDCRYAMGDEEYQTYWSWLADKVIAVLREIRDEEHHVE